MCLMVKIDELVYFGIRFDWNDINKNNSVVEFINLLDEEKFDYLRNTFIPNQEEKIRLIELFDKKIEFTLQNRNLDEPNYWFSKRINFPTRNFIWRNGIVTIYRHTVELYIGNLLSLYEELQNAYENKTNIYFDFFNEDLIQRKGNRKLYQTIDSYFWEYWERKNIKKIKMKEMAKSLKMPFVELSRILLLFQETGLVRILDNDVVTLTPRGHHILLHPSISSYGD